MQGRELRQAPREQSSSVSNLKHLTEKNRNRLRAIFNLGSADTLKVFNILRNDASAKEIYHAEVMLAQTPYLSYKVSEAFPASPQVKENYSRLTSLDLEKQCRLLELYVENNFSKLLDFCSYLKVLNEHAFNKRFEEFDVALHDIHDKFGFSHFLLRKACWINSEASEDVKLNAVDELLQACGIGEKNILATSIVNCFSDGLDYLALRKSMLGIPVKGIKGVRNQFTRDMVRLIFHPHAFDRSDLSSMIQSCMQSSLVDALVCLKINRAYLPVVGYESCDRVCDALESATVGIDALAELYLSREDSEDIFFQRTGAWLESSEVIEYRLLNDFFYDPVPSVKSPNLEHFVDRCAAICSLQSISELKQNQSLTNHNFPNLRSLESEGAITRSSVCNFILFKNGGDDNIEEEALLWLMAHTRDLHRTINVEYAKRLISHLKSRLSKIIIFLLIVKRSRDDLSSNKLTRLLEGEIIENYSGDLMVFIDSLGRRYEDIAIYLHEICTEDFLARLTKIIPETKAISDTRAALHEWRGKKTGDHNFLDRAKSIRIDYKISLVRGEIDDNRIYVDPSRFLDWVADNVAGELTMILTSMNHNLGVDEKVDDPQLRDLISRCYQEFCSNKHYGIASYIGRRIRHGTFKGHVFTNVILVEKNHSAFLSDTSVSEKYRTWRDRYEKLVTFAVTEKLHIEISTKKGGLIKPDTRSAAKQEVVTACMFDLMKFYRLHGVINNSPAIILDYCWRMVELDLLAIRSYIKSMKSKLALNELNTDLKKSWAGQPQMQSAFAQELQLALNKQFKLAQNWFKRPPSVSPKANINLLYKAVIGEVQETYPVFNTDANYDEDDGLELFGEVYHRIYDALFVIIFNAAKHGKVGLPLERYFMFERGQDGSTYLLINISSVIRDDQSEEEVTAVLCPGPNIDISDAHMHENRSGIPKLYNLTMADDNFFVECVKCSARKVTIAISYRMAY
ncbi:hypothetical protein [Pseudomonas viridiflava]|uniref:hypothetical protein n=1 Tax=Pseudomonas viridiflava TaxID=33069 RepID=UPI002E9BFAFD|nr:hypothetical protein [Pseudomonas viridiflava]MEE3930019.1 hypothetical protein [Pseudomonas viridiflava]MEE3940226.1 hypothetical protein [Pseudomonas viridiflava]MEE3966256.1 hypothetical protein [Pseudomonas viridiflava]MEE3980314.1 hypothetical protein [Pseudomonas viridiflava]